VLYSVISKPKIPYVHWGFIYKILPTLQIGSVILGDIQAKNTVRTLGVYIQDSANPTNR